MAPMLSGVPGLSQFCSVFCCPNVVTSQSLCRAHDVIHILSTLLARHEHQCFRTPGRELRIESSVIR